MAYLRERLDLYSRERLVAVLRNGEDIWIPQNFVVDIWLEVTLLVPSYLISFLSVGTGVCMKCDE